MSATNPPTATNLGLLLIRTMLAVVFVHHGQGKLFGGLEEFTGYLATMGVPLPHLAALLAGLSEFLGGLVLLAGIGFRFALWPLVVTMLVAAFGAHGGAFDVRADGMEYPLTLAVVVSGLALIGPGAWTAGRLLAGRPEQTEVRP